MATPRRPVWKRLSVYYSAFSKRDIDIDIIIVINAQLRYKNNLGFSGLFLQDNLVFFLEPEWQHWQCLRILRLLLSATRKGETSVAIITTCTKLHSLLSSLNLNHLKEFHEVGTAVIVYCNLFRPNLFVVWGGSIFINYKRSNVTVTFIIMIDSLTIHNLTFILFVIPYL